MAKQYALHCSTVLSLLCVMMLIASSEAATNKTAGTTKAATTDRSDPWDRQTLPPQPRVGYYKFLGDCINKLTKPCGLQIFDSIYGKAAVDKPCCQKIKEMGELCAKSLSYTLGQIQKYKADAQLITKKSDEAYDKCVKGASTTTGSTSKTK